MNNYNNNSIFIINSDKNNYYFKINKLSKIKFILKYIWFIS